MLVRPILLVVALCLMPLVSRPAAIAAQDCGTGCGPCPEEGYEGTSYHQYGANNMTCYPNIPWCVRCGSPELVDVGGTPGGILDLLDRAAPEHLADLVERHRDRLLLNRAGTVLVITGDGCDAATIAAVLVTRAKQRDILKRLKLYRLEPYLESIKAVTS